jgi:hypothetical protein
MAAPFPYSVPQQKFATARIAPLSRPSAGEKRFYAEAEAIRSGRVA